MQKIGTILMTALLISCNEAGDYHGRVLDEHNQPLEQVTVTEDGREPKVRTDANGYFRLGRSANWLGNLIFSKEGYTTDTIPSVWHHSGETTEYNFVLADTTTVILKKP